MTALLAALLLLAGASGPKLIPPRAGAPHSVMPSARPATVASLFSSADYPAAALKAHEQGTAAYRILIGTDGIVHDCTITTSSGSAALDEATCRIIRARARFKPARNSAGAPVAAEFRGEIRWVSAPTY